MVRPAGSTTKHLTDADRQRIRTLYHDAKLSQPEIAELTGYTKNQVRTAIRAHSAAVAPRSGRPRVMTAQQEEELVEYVTSSKEGRRASFLRLSCILFSSFFGAYAIRAALRRLGFQRRSARRKPSISETNRQKRLAWAYENNHWTVEDWRKVLWTDETWITGGHHTKLYVTRRPGEEWDPTCIIEKHQRKRGWMFWVCFSGDRKGPGIFWEKNWGSVNAETYQQYTVPIIDGWIRLCQQQYRDNLILMQDGAPAHSAGSTIEDLNDRGVQVIYWPPFSPDLNPIETCWNWMKDYIQEAAGITENPSYDTLRIWVKEAWDAIPEHFLSDLLSTMPDRCKAVIEANGMHFKY
ncbi:hypothetical protein CMUS01_12404 [Colletotrichum musicola]|uniref:Tc1-like transposase DDE domain-containing protein n=1 Tax=Colletotrichum musicola TaxID=2175873 RepID=A0A8H6JMW3_9PEZI|nr:hypothetical protein CMUS01_12404 [Colletotrichum musicola]